MSPAQHPRAHGATHRRSRTEIAAVVVLAILCLPSCMQQTYGEAGADASIPQKLVILHSTDTHSKYLPFWMEPNFFDKQMGLVPRFPACWDLDWGGGASYCEGAYIADRQQYRVFSNGVYVYLRRDQLNPDYPIEDLNHDGVCDLKDCQTCWDVDRDRRCDASEDVDGVLGCDVGDCIAQPDVPSVYRCWDTGSPDDPTVPNGQCDPFEDLNRDHECGYDDCALVWDRDHDWKCDHPFDLINMTYLDDNDEPITIGRYGDDLSYMVAYNTARQDSEDTNKDGICTYGDYRPGLFNTGGVARVATMQKWLMAKHEGVPVLRLDSGDSFQGAPQFNLYRGELEMLTIQKLGMDAMCVGNHEFDNGPRALVSAYRKAGGFALLAANYVFDQEDDYGLTDIISPYYIFRRGKLRIGVIGIGNDSSLTSIYNVSGSLGFNAYEPISIAQRYVDVVAPQVDLVILLSHQGLDGDFELARKVRGVDVILGGHHHVVLDPVKVLRGPDGRDVVVAHSGVNYKILGELELAVANERVVWHRYATHPITDSIPPDPQMLNVIEPFVQGLTYAQDLTRVVGRASSTIKRTDPNGGDSPLGNITTDAMIQHELSRAQFAVTNTLGIRADIPTGDIVFEKLYEVYPFENTIVTMYLNGKEIKEMFDFVARRSATRGCKTQLQVSGMRVVLDCSPDPALVTRYNSFALTEYLAIGPSVIIENYELLQPHMIFKMATNDYMGGGGSGFDMLERNTTRLDTSVSLRDAVVEFFQSREVIDPMDFTSGTGTEPKRVTMKN